MYVIDVCVCVYYRYLCEGHLELGPYGVGVRLGLRVRHLVGMVKVSVRGWGMDHDNNCVLTQTKVQECVWRETEGERERERQRERETERERERDRERQRERERERERETETERDREGEREREREREGERLEYLLETVEWAPPWPLACCPCRCPEPRC